MNELTDVPIDRIPLSSLPGNLPPPRPPASASAPPPPSEPAAEPSAPPAPKPRWVKEALRDLVKLNRKKGIALSAAGSLVAAALAMNALFSGASREPETPTQPARAAAQPVAQAAPPAAPPAEVQTQRDVPPPEPVVPAAPPAEAAAPHRTGVTGLPAVEVAAIPAPAPPTDARTKIEQAAAALNIPTPAVVIAAPDPTKPAPSRTEPASGGIQIPGVVPAAASEPASTPAPPAGSVVVPAALPSTTAPKPATAGGVPIPPPPDLTNPTPNTTAPIVPNINTANSATGGVKPTAEPVGIGTPNLTVPAPVVTETNTKPIAVPPISASKPSVPGVTGDSKKLDPPPLNIGNTTPGLPTPNLDDKKNNLPVPPVGDVKTNSAVPTVSETKLEPAASANNRRKPEATVPGRAATLASPTLPPPVARAEQISTPVDASKTQPPAPSAFGGLNDPPKPRTPAPAAPKPSPAPSTEPFRLTKQAEPDVRQASVKSLPPARTSFDVDIHYPKAGETYSSISKLHYGDARYAAALQSFNQGRALDQGDSVQIPPLYVLRQRATPGAPAARPAGSGLEWASSGPPTAAPTYVVPRDGMTMWDVAGDLYGDRQKWGKVWDVNQRIEPNAQLPKGTKLQLPPDARQ